MRRIKRSIVVSVARALRALFLPRSLPREAGELG